MELETRLVCIVAEQEEAEVLGVCMVEVPEMEEEAAVGLLEEQEDSAAAGRGCMRRCLRMTCNYPRRELS